MILPHHDSRSSTSSISIAWSPALRNGEEITQYHLECKWTTEPSTAWAATAALNSPVSLPSSPWSEIYSGTSRTFNYTSLVPGTTYLFRVRALGRFTGYSPYSFSTPLHTLLPANLDAVPIEIIGSGRNNPGFSTLKISGFTIFSRRDVCGLILVVLARHNLKLQSIQVFDTAESESASDDLASAILSADASSFIIVFSADHWEGSVTSRLVNAMEFSGAYHFAHAVAVTRRSMTQRDASSYSLLFGHPYAFIGIPGVGTGAGSESLQPPTGHYLATDKVERAIIRLTLQYDFVTRGFSIADRKTFAHPHYVSLPTLPSASRTPTVHFPIPAEKIPTAPAPLLPASLPPYVGTMPVHAEGLIAGNKSHILNNYTNNNFQVILSVNLPEPLSFFDPSKAERMTELERIWGGPSERYDEVTGVMIQPGLVERVCEGYLNWRWNATNAACQDADCCTGFTRDAPEFMRLGVGLWPTLCLPGSCDAGAHIETFELFADLPVPS